jgi:hypothetical protein
MGLGAVAREMLVVQKVSSDRKMTATISERREAM